MTRNLKFLGLAVMAAMALSAFAAQAAFAEEFTSPEAGGGTTTFTGTQEKHTETVTGNLVFDKFKTTSGTLECTTATYKGTQTGNNATTATVAPTYSGCTFGGIATTIETNGCKYKFTITGVKTGTVDIVECTAGSPGIQATVGAGTIRCTIDVPEQNGINGVTYANIGAGATREITVKVDANNLHYRHTEGTGVGHCTGSILQETGIYEGAATVTGENGVPAHLGILID